MQLTDSALPTSEHFRLEQIAEGVYAAIACEGGAAASNAGIIDLGDCTLIFDTFLTPRAAEDLRTAAEHLTGRSATYVVNSHAHSDHWYGNQVFASHATIIATHKTRESMTTNGADFLNQHKDDLTILEKQIRADKERLKTETDERARASLESSIAKFSYVLESLPTLTLCFPNQTFGRKLVFHGTQRTAELLTYGSGHTSSDAFLVLPAERLAFTGDLAFFQRHPFLGSSIPSAWVVVLERIEQSDIETFVPGHGPLGTKADIALEKRYIIVLEELAALVVEAGGSADDAAQQPVPAPFDAWGDGQSRFERNMRFLYQRLAGQ